MANPIEDSVYQVLAALFENDPSGEGEFEGADIASFTGLSARSINDAVEILDNRALINRFDYMGTSPFDFGQVSLNARGKHLYYEHKQSQSPKKAHNSMKVFISHSSKDIRVVKEVVQLLRSALNLATKDIRCTSLEGYRLPVGVTTDKQLKAEILGSEVLVGLISAESINSHYVLFELGARWGTDRPIAPLIIDDKGASVLKGPLQGINALDAHVEGQLFQFVTDIGEILGITPEGPGSYQHHIKDVVSSLSPVREKGGVASEKMTNDAPEESSSSIPQPADDYSDSDTVIKAHCKKAWATDFQMQTHCIKEQRGGVQLLQQGKPADIEQDDFLAIRKKAAADWPDDFYMRAHQEKEQFQALRTLREM
jgi:hypothetical protein